MKNFLIGLVMTLILSNVMLASEVTSQHFTTKSSANLDQDLFSELDGEMMTLSEMEAVEGDGLLGAFIGGAFGTTFGNIMSSAWQLNQNQSDRLKGSCIILFSVSFGYFLPI